MPNFDAYASMESDFQRMPSKEDSVCGVLK
jgi:hypothetical protein